MPCFETDIVIIGGGVVGLAVAARLAPQREVLLLERRSSFGQGTSSRNSEVVHAGIYYEPGSLKARLSVAGRREIEALAAEGRFEYQRLGKLIVAANESEQQQLHFLERNGLRNGVEDLEMIDAERLAELEPSVRAHAALWSPATGILDSHGLMRWLRQEAERDGAVLACRSEVCFLKRNSQGWELGIHEYGKDPGPCMLGEVHELPDCLAPSTTSVLKANWVINCAGLQADAIASMAGVPVHEAGLRQYWSRGEYFMPAGVSPRVNHLVYPVPDSSSGGHLGIHATLDLAGQLRFGPSAAWSKPLLSRDENYLQDDSLERDFVTAVRRFLPDLQDELQPAGVGLRARAYGPDTAARDFYIMEESGRGLPGLVNLIGIESPGLTSAPAIGSLVAGMVEKKH